MELMFVRHAEPAWVVDNKSVINPALTERGHRQAQLLADRAQGWPRPEALYVSPTTRSQQTAAPISEALGLPIITLPWMEEMRLPADWDGAPAAEIGKVFRTSRERSEDEWWQGFAGAETYQAFHDRVTQGLDELLKTHGLKPPRDGPPVFKGDYTDNLRCVFVAHGGTNAVALGHLLGLPPVPWAWERLVIQHTGISRVSGRKLLEGTVFGLVTHSDVAHLPKEQRSR